MDDQSQRVAALKKVPLLAGAKDDELAALAVEITSRAFKAGDELVREGELGSEGFFVVEGACEVRRKSSKKPIATLGPGQMFGEMAVIDADPRNASVVAKGDTKAYVLTGWGFRSAIH